MKESKLPKRFWLIIAVAMILVSMIGSNLVQSDGGKVKIHKVNVHGFLPESDQLLSADQFCHQVAGDLLIPFSNEIQITFI